MRNDTIKICLAITVLLSTPFLAIAAPKGSVEVDSSSLISTVANGEFITCAFIDSSWLPVRFIGNSSTTVISYLQDQKNSKAKAKRLKKKNKSKSKKQRQKARKSKKIHNSQLPTCQLNGSGNPTEGSFDSAGNVTSSGKTTFGIPSSLSANITTGKSVHDQKCAGCHDAGRSLPSSLWNFNSVRAATQGAPMFLDFGNLSNAELANIMAYLFRFNS